jgi:hypothetical protein
MLRFAGFHVTHESSNSLRIVNPQTNERTDFTIHNWPNVTAHGFDVCITDARLVAHLQAPRPLAAATTSKEKNDQALQGQAQGSECRVHAVGHGGRRKVREASSAVFQEGGTRGLTPDKYV